MENNSYKIIYDLKRQLVNNIKFKQGDVDSSSLEVTLMDNGKVVDITGETIEFRFYKADKTTVYQDISTGVTIIDGLGGVVSCLLMKNTLAYPGVVVCEINRKEDGKELTTPSFNFTVQKSIGADGILSTNYIGAIENKIIEWQSEFDVIKNIYETASHDNVNLELVNARKGEVDLGTKIGKLDSSLANMTKEKVTFHASKLINKLQNGENGVIVFIGDSTTEVNGTTNGQPNSVQLLTTWLQGLYPGLLTVFNAGISGNNITMMLERLYKDVLSKNPDLIIVCSGINDQGGTYNITLDEFKNNYNVLVKEIISQSDTDIILRTPNCIMSVATSDAINVYNDVTRAVAKKYNLGLFDLFNLMREDIAKGIVDLTTAGINSPFLNDGVHPNANGHIYISNNFKTYFEPKEFVQKPLNIFNMISSKGGFRYVNGTEFSGVSYVNGYALIFNNPTKKITFEYEGEDITLIYGMTTGTGQFIVYIDGVAQPLVDTYNPIVLYRGSVSYAVTSGKHLIEIEDQTTKNASSSSTNLQIQAVIYKKVSKVNMGLIPIPYSIMEIVATVAVALTNGVETTLIFNSLPVNIGDFATLNTTTGEVTFKKAGLYNIICSNRFTTDADKSLEVNYKVNNSTIRRKYSRTTSSTTATTQIVNLDLLDNRVLNINDILKFVVNVQGTTPTDIVFAQIIKLG